MSYNSCYCTSQDGTERNIETISLIDAVLPDVIEQRKQGAIKGSQVKSDVPGVTGEEGRTPFLLIFLILLPAFLMSSIFVAGFVALMKNVD